MYELLETIRSAIKLQQRHKTKYQFVKKQPQYRIFLPLQFDQISQTARSACAPILRVSSHWQAA